MKTINIERFVWCIQTSSNRKIAHKKYLNSKKVVKIAYSTFCRKIKKLGISVSHFVRKVRKWTEYDYVVHNHSIGKRPNNVTRNKIVKKLGAFCVCCGMTLGLELHHIDHNHNNTKISNLKVLCGTCHNIEHSKC